MIILSNDPYEPTPLVLNGNTPDLHVLLLCNAIKEEESPILLTHSTLLNYTKHFTALTSPRQWVSYFPIQYSEWWLFSIKDSPYYLLLPIRYIRNKQQQAPALAKNATNLLGFDFNYLEDLSKFLPVDDDNFEPLQKQLFQRGLPPFLNPDIPSKIFKRNTPPDQDGYWTFFIAGHGSPQGFVAGAEASIMLGLLSFFDATLNINLAYIISCFLGGPNKFLLLPHDHKPYHFTLALGCITDCITVLHGSDMSFEDFFTQAEDQLTPLEDHLPDIFTPITPMQASTWSTHGVSSIPQACLAHTTKFGAIEIDHSVASYHADDESFRNTSPKRPRRNSGPKPAQLQEKRAILLHEQTYPTPMLITPARIQPTIHKDQTDPLSYIPTAASKAVLNILNTEEPNNRTPALLAATEASLAAHPHGTTLLSALDQLNLQEILFPTIISMLHSPKSIARIHHCAEVQVENTLHDRNIPWIGVMHFLRDAFFDLSSCSAQTIFLIDTLIGFNDFSVFFELQSLLYKTPLPPFALALHHYTNKNIALSKVYIQTQGYLGKNRDEIDVKIIFILDEHAWQLCFRGKLSDFPQSTAWNFKIIFDGALYNHEYETFKKQLTDTDIDSTLEMGFAHLQVSSA